MQHFFPLMVEYLLQDFRRIVAFILKSVDFKSNEERGFRRTYKYRIMFSFFSENILL